MIKLLFMNSAIEFLHSLPLQARDKIYYNIHRVVNGEKDESLFKKLENSEIWEFRTQYNKTAYRLFSFWDKEEETLIVATHGIIKKKQKTPSKEISKAEKARKNYYKDK